jgi:hypothetical protein
MVAPPGVNKKRAKILRLWAFQRGLLGRVDNIWVRRGTWLMEVGPASRRSRRKRPAARGFRLERPAGPRTHLALGYLVDQAIVHTP